MSYGNLVVRVKDEAVVLTEIAGDVELGIDVVLHLVVVAVKMVRGDVGDDGNVRTEVADVVKLEAGDLKHIVVKVLGSHLIGIALADISAKANVEASILEEVVDEGGSGGLAVGSGDADLLCRVVAACKFNLGDDGDAVLLHLLHHGHGAGDAGGFHHLIGIKDEFLRMLTLLKGNVPLAEGIGITFLDLSLV